MLHQLYVHPWYKVELEDKFELERVDGIENHFCKPDGGLWTSTFDERIGSAWLQSDYVEKNKKAVGYLLKVKSEARVLEVNSVKYAKEVAQKYFVNDSLGANEYDYEKMSLEYDGVRVSEEALLQQSPFREWEIECTLWFNSKVLSVEKVIDVQKWMK